ncbi:MAG: SH3 domain-containing protein [Oscillospiraceae bacterium]|nr:SH3 domain-containing protein [Oscillospiraceae bacterium]
MKKFISVLLASTLLFSVAVIGNATAEENTEDTVITTDFTVPTEFTDNTVSTISTESTKSTESTESTVSTQPTEPTENTEPTQPKDTSPKKIKFSEDNEILMKGEEYSCKVEYKPDDAKGKGVKYTSSDTKVATVNKKGIVKAKNKGICYISATSSTNSKIKSTNELKIIVTDFKFTKSFLTRNNCYKEGVAIDPKGIVVHSTGCNNPNAYSYIRNWNYPTPGGREVCVHGFVGKNPKGTVQFYQALPFEMACWGVGSGSKGSYNYYPGYIQFECCEDTTYNPSYFYTVYDEATDLCAYLCLKYNLPVEKVVSHREACLQGYGSAHGDIDHWLYRYSLTMSDFRKTVKSKIYKIDPKPDLTSGKKHKKVTVKRDTCIRKDRVVDDYGTSSKVLTTVSKNSTVKFIRDRRGGWSYVKTENGKEGYIFNEDLNLEYKSKFFTGIAPSTLKIYSVPTEKSKYYLRNVPKGAKVKFISQIKKGSKKGWAYIKYKDKYGYVHNTIPYNDN